METTETILEPSTTSGKAARLMVVHAACREEVGRCIVVGTGPIQVGRAPGMGGFTLDDSGVSRAHATVTWQSASQPCIRDLESRNGTFVNGRRIDQQTLQSEDVIRIGNHVLLFQILTYEECQALLAESPPASEHFIGTGPRMGLLRQAIAEAARETSPLLILGETGVGKELVARAIHAQSTRPGPLITVNCAALPDQLVESELFGHVKGAFTGAERDRAGLFAEAAHGTLFLDEIGDMPMGQQAKLLRALALGEIRRVGESKASQVDVRLVAATNIDLESATRQGRFRADLYARLLGASIHVPPLRERKEDVLTLARAFLRAHGSQAELSSDTAEALLIHRWPYNVRELEQLMARAAAVQRSVLMLESLPDVLRAPLLERASRPAGDFEESLHLLQIARDRSPNHEELRAVLQHFGGNVVRVAAFFRKDRRQIYRWCEQLGVHPRRLPEHCTTSGPRDDGQLSS